MTNLNDFAKKANKGMSKGMYDPYKGECLTIDKITSQEFKLKDGGSEVKPILHWVEDRPPLTLNKGNLNFIRGQFGDTEADFAGRRVEVFHDPEVMMGSSKVGGLRLRLPRGSVPAGQPGAF